MHLLLPGVDLLSTKYLQLVVELTQSPAVQIMLLLEPLQVINLAHKVMINVTRFGGNLRTKLLLFFESDEQ